jgi:hypothetical protein
MNLLPKLQIAIIITQKKKEKRKTSLVSFGSIVQKWKVVGNAMFVMRVLIMKKQVA